MLDRDWSLEWGLVFSLIPVSLASAATVRGFVRDGFHGTPPDWIRAFLLLSWLVPFGWLVVLLAT
jgi:hypothetical protein